MWVYLHAFVTLCVAQNAVQAQNSSRVCRGESKLIFSRAQEPFKCASSLRLCFLDWALDGRGMPASTFQYAKYASTVLGHHSISLIGSISNAAVDLKTTPMPYSDIKVTRKALQHWCQHFPVYYFDGGIGGLKGAVEAARCDAVYVQHLSAHEHNFVRVLRSAGVPTMVHCMGWCSVRQGTSFAVISEWAEARFHVGPVVRLSVDPCLPESPTDTLELRATHGVPTDAPLLCYLGGPDSFSLQWVVRELFSSPAIVDSWLKEFPTLHLMFMPRNDVVPNHPRIHFNPFSSSVKAKAAFVHACDAMLHARSNGESFGMAVAEFSVCNKPVITQDRDASDPSYETAHLDMLGSKAWAYQPRSKESFLKQVRRLVTESRAVLKAGSWNAHEANAPETLMRDHFHPKFLKPLGLCGDGASNQAKGRMLLSRMRTFNHDASLAHGAGSASNQANATCTSGELFGSAAIAYSYGQVLDVRNVALLPCSWSSEHNRCSSPVHVIHEDASVISMLQAAIKHCDTTWFPQEGQHRTVPTGHTVPVVRAKQASGPLATERPDEIVFLIDAFGMNVIGHANLDVLFPLATTVRALFRSETFLDCKVRNVTCHTFVVSGAAASQHTAVNAYNREMQALILGRPIERADAILFRRYARVIVGFLSEAQPVMWPNIFLNHIRHRRHQHRLWNDFSSTLRAELGLLRQAGSYGAWLRREPSAARDLGARRHLTTREFATLRSRACVGYSSGYSVGSSAGSSPESECWMREVYLHRMPFLEQARFMQGARLLGSFEGSSFVNQLFMPPGGVLVRTDTTLTCSYP